MGGKDESSSRKVPDGPHRRQPWHFRLLVRVSTGLLALLMWCWFKTVRVTVLGAENDQRLRAQGPVIYAGWHRTLIWAVFFFRGRDGRMMASSSKDGEWATGIIRWFGNDAVRGSSSRDGRKALHDLVDCIKAGHDGGLVADGPRGPAQQSKPGILVVAQRTGLPILPVQFAAESCIRLSSWDRTVIPLPFSRMVVKYGEPFPVDPALSEEAFERRREQFDEVMNRLTDEVDGYFQGNRSRSRSLGAS